MEHIDSLNIEPTTDNGSDIFGTVIGVVTVGLLGYLGYKVAKQGNDLDRLDDALNNLAGKQRQDMDVVKIGLEGSMTGIDTLKDNVDQINEALVALDAGKKLPDVTVEALKQGV